MRRGVGKRQGRVGGKENKITCVIAVIYADKTEPYDSVIVRFVE